MAKQSPPPDDDPADDPDFADPAPASTLPAKRATLTPTRRPVGGTLPSVATTEALPADTRTPNERALAHGASDLKLTREEQGILAGDVNPDDVLIRPDGIVYLAHAKLRQILNRSVGIGQWAMVPQGAPLLDSGRNRVEVLSNFFVRGHFMDQAMGEQEYHPNSPTMSYADAIEGAKSNALTRHCKAVGIGLELWDKRWRDRWIAQHAVKVKVRKRDGQIKLESRRKDDPPLPGEVEEAPGGRRASVASPAPAESQAAPRPSRPAPSPKAAAPPAAEPDPDADPDQGEVLEVEFRGKSGRTMKIWRHREWDGKNCISEGKIAKVQIQALVGARQSGVPEADVGEVARQTLSRVAGGLGHEHFSLCPWRGDAFDRLCAEVAEAFGGGD